MGASNVKAAYVLWRAKLPDKPFTVLVYMALVARDRDDPPRYFGGWEQLSRSALGRPEADAAAELSVKRAVAPLTKAGAIVRENVPGTGSRAVYRLCLDPASAGHEPTPSRPNVGIANRPPQGITHRPPAGDHSVSNQGVTYRPPKEEELQEDSQDLLQESDSTTPTTVTRCIGCGGRVADGDCVAGCDR